MKKCRQHRFQTALLSVALCAVTLLASCDDSVFFAAERDVDVKGWNMNDEVDYYVNVEDTAQLYDFYVDVRNTTHYPNANAFLFIATTFPDGSRAFDTLECPLADVQGHWYGKKTGRYVDSRYVFRRHVYFPQKGCYHFEMRHGMRDTNVVGIKSVGLRIEKFVQK